MDYSDEYLVGKQIPTWKDAISQTVTFIITEDCNLRCKYCYITHKASNKKMSFETAKKFIDFILSDEISHSEAVIIEFIGGEPLIEVGLMDKILDYFKIKSYQMQHSWFWNYRVSISTNGVNYSSKEVQDFIKKNDGKLSIGITIDGIREKHDLNRVFLNGSGSYDVIEQNIPLWLSQMPPATKVTFASKDLIYLKDSIISLYNKGITGIAANVVFEDVWNEGDDLLFENQLIELADYIIDNDLYNKFYCTLFSDAMGGYYSKYDLMKTHCGAGKMIALGPNGNIYPCMRYKDYSLNKKKEWIFGNIETGIHMEMVRPFMLASVKYQSDLECLNCPIAIGCAYCQGFGYDEASTETNFARAKYICKMQKAQYKANDYYFGRLHNEKHININNHNRIHSKLLFTLSDDFVTFCEFENKNLQTLNKMSDIVILKGLEYARNHFMKPVFIHSSTCFNFEMRKEWNSYRINHIIPYKFKNDAIKSHLNQEDCIYVLGVYEVHLVKTKIEKIIFNIDQNDIYKLSNSIINLFSWVDYIYVNVLNLDESFNEDIYTTQLLDIEKYLYQYNLKHKKEKGINLITDLCNLSEHRYCGVGDKTFSYAYNGKFYICPAFYMDNKENYLKMGDENNELDLHLFTGKYQPLCEICDSLHCLNCAFRNKKVTNEVNVSPSFQCRKATIERNVTRKYQIDMNFNTENILKEIDYKDPIDSYLEMWKLKAGYYKTKGE